MSKLFFLSFLLAYYLGSVVFALGSHLSSLRLEGGNRDGKGTGLKGGAGRGGRLAGRGPVSQYHLPAATEQKHVTAARIHTLHYTIMHRSWRRAPRRGRCREWPPPAPSSPQGALWTPRSNRAGWCSRWCTWDTFNAYYRYELAVFLQNF